MGRCTLRKSGTAADGGGSASGSGWQAWGPFRGVKLLNACVHRRAPAWLTSHHLLPPCPPPPPQLDMNSLKKDPRVRERYQLDRQPGQPTELESFYSRLSAWFRPKDEDW